MGQILYMAEELFDTLINDDELARDVTCYHLHCRPTSSAVSSNVFQCRRVNPVRTTLDSLLLLYYYIGILFMILYLKFKMSTFSLHDTLKPSAKSCSIKIVQRRNNKLKKNRVCHNWIHNIWLRKQTYTVPLHRLQPR